MVEIKKSFIESLTSLLKYDFSHTILRVLIVSAIVMILLWLVCFYVYGLSEDNSRLFAQYFCIYGFVEAVLYAYHQRYRMSRMGKLLSLMLELFAIICINITVVFALSFLFLAVFFYIAICNGYHG